jgi:hypothetical protein
MPHKLTTGGKVTDVLLAGVLGAAVLAIVLLARSVRRLAEQTNQLRAEVTAQKIAALQQRAPAPAPVDEEPEPVRRKRHLALYIGGGVAAFLTSLGERLRAMVNQHRRAAAAGTVVVVAAASTAAALYLTNDARPETGGTHPLITATDTPGDDADTRDQAAPVAHTSSVGPDAAADQGHSIEQRHGSPSPTPSPSSAQEPDTSASPSPAETGLDEPSPPVSAKPTATPTPSTPDSSTPVPEPSSGGQTGDGGEQEDDGDCVIRIHVPPLADLCV